MNSVQKAIEGLSQARKEASEELERIDAALAALRAGSGKSRTSRSTKPCCTKREVVDVVMQLLRDNGVLSRDELEGLAKDKLANDLGKSLSGFAMRLKEPLLIQPA